MSQLIKDSQVSFLTVIDKYETSWVQNTAPEWRNVEYSVTHNLNANLSSLIVKFYVSSDGTEANAKEICTYAPWFYYGAQWYRYGVMAFQVSINAIKIQTGAEGVAVCLDDGTHQVLDNDNPGDCYYYKTVVYKFNTGEIVLGNNLTAPIGSVQMYAGSTAPTGWLLCDGTAVSRTTYARLFAIIGTEWGAGDGSTTFNLPDGVGASPKGVGTSTGYTQNETIALGTKYDDQMQGHWHKLGYRSAVPESAVPVANDTGLFEPTGQSSYNTLASAGVYSLTSDGTNGTPRTGTVTRTKSFGINYIIKY